MQVLLLSTTKNIKLPTTNKTIPACLFPVRGDSTLGRWLEAVQSLPNIEDIFINVHYSPDLFFTANGKYLAARKPIKPITFLYEPALLGDAGTLRKVLPMVTNSLLVIDSDSYFEEKEKEILQQLTYSNNSFVCFNHTNNLAKLQNGRVSHIVNGDIRFFQDKPKKPRGKYFNVGIYYFTKQSLNLIKKSSVIDIATDVLPTLVKNKQLKSVILEQQYLNVFTPKEGELVRA